MDWEVVILAWSRWSHWDRQYDHLKKIKHVCSMDTLMDNCVNGLLSAQLLDHSYGH
jgi:hypothetical protein